MKQLALIIVVLSCFLPIQTFSQSLESILQLVVENNPELKALHLEYDAELLRKDQVSQLPDPTLGVGVPIFRPETRLGPQVLMISASQMFPWFGTNKAKEDVVISMSKTRFEKIELSRLQLFNKVQVAYFELALIDKEIAINDSMIRQFEALSSITLAQIEGGKSSAANLFRIQLRTDELRQEIQKLTVKKEISQAVINGVTGQSWETETTAEMAFNIPVLDIELSSIENSIKENYPMIVQLNSEIELAEKRQALNQKMGMPTISVGLDYSVVTERTDANPQYNGRDIFVPKVMVSLPIYRKKYKAKDAEENARMDALEYRKADVISQIMTKIIASKTNYSQAVLDNELGSKQIETIRITYAIMLSEYSVDGRNIDDLLEIENLRLKYRLKIARSIYATQKAKADIEVFTNSSNKN